MSDQEITVDLDTLHEQLELIYIKSCRVAKEHRELVYALGIPRTYFKYYDPIFEETDYYPQFSRDSDDYMENPGKMITWVASDNDNDFIAMSVPVKVLDGRMTVQEWAENTYKVYQEKELEKSKKKQERELKHKKERRQDYERLKLEFDNER